MTQQSPDSSPPPEAVNQTSPLSAAESDSSGISRRGLLRGAAVSAASLGALGGLVLPTGATASAAPALITHHPATSPAVPQQPVNSKPAVEFPRGGQLREYWFQVDSFFHNIMPSGIDGMTGNAYMANQTSFWALGYRAFTPNWGQPLPGNDDIGPNTGIPGPLIRAAVGDTVHVHFRNNDTYYKKAHTIAPHAFKYTLAHDGGWAWLGLIFVVDEHGGAWPVLLTELHGMQFE